MGRVRLYTHLVVILCILSFQAFAQIGSATITGTVTDPTGAAVAGVKVVIVETSMNFESRSVTNADGLYRVQSLQPGTYDVSFESSGFKRLVQHGILLKVGDTLPLEMRPEALVQVRCGNVLLTEGRMGRVGDRVAIRVTKQLRKPNTTFAMFEKADEQTKLMEAQ